jgi:hypothetical protein
VTGTGQRGNRAPMTRVAGPEVTVREARSRPTAPDLSGQARVRKVAAGPQERRERGPGERRERGPGERPERELGVLRPERGRGERRERGPEWDQAGSGPSSAVPMTGGLRFRRVSRPTNSTQRRARS